MNRLLVLIMPIGVFSCLIFFPSYSLGPGSSNIAVSSAVGEQSCVMCHNDAPLNSGPGSFEIDFNFGENGYEPGKTYPIEIIGKGGDGIAGYGFQLTVLKKSDDKNAGTLVSGDGSAVVTVGERDYIEHTSPSLAGKWTFQWEAPSEDVGPVVFYVAGNSASYPISSTIGDIIYTNSLEIENKTVSTKDIEAIKASMVFNSAAQKLSVVLQSPTTGLGRFSVVDVSGKIVSSFGKELVLGQNNFNIPMPMLNNGIYFISINVGQHSFMSPVFVGR